MTGRFILICGALFLLGNVAFGDGTYQRTKDGKTFVWNNDPKASDEAAWSGERDREGYATGFGTLTWYSGKKQTVRHLGIPVTTSDIYARYFGNMIRGKFNGSVNVHSKGKTDHAIFADGVRTTRWAAGPASYRATAPQVVAAVKKNKAPEPEAPAAGPPAQRSEVKSEKPADEVEKLANANSSPVRSAPENQPVDRPVAKPLVTKKSQGEIEDSLQSLVGPPSSLHAVPEATPPPENNPRLTKEEVVDLADAEARSRGYDPAEYQRAEPQFDPTYETWSLIYEQHAVEGTEGGGKHFSVTIDDKTKGMVFVPRR